jgi:hypothetical protein
LSECKRERRTQMVRAKFRVNEIRRVHCSVRNDEGKYVPGEMHTIVMSPTYSDDPNSENKKFWDASPGGKFELNCVPPAAVAEFKLGKDYYFDIHEAPES